MEERCLVYLAIAIAIWALGGRLFGYHTGPFIFRSRTINGRTLSSPSRPAMGQLAASQLQ
jgi:hypothetical protein